MENREQQILSEIKVIMASVRSQLERLDAKMAELQQVVDPEDFESESIDISIDLEDVIEPAIVEDRDLVADPVPVAEPDPEPGPVPEPEPLPLVTEDYDDDLPEAVEEAPKPTINDVMAPDHAWRKDMPGTPVKDVRSAISLNDRVIFINLLFDEDAQKFVDALSVINSMDTLDQVVDFISSEYPSWDLNSEFVYRFMMAVRRKVR